MTYREGSIRLDLSSSGRGLQQTMLILAYLYSNPGGRTWMSRTRTSKSFASEIYRLITEVARESDSQE